MFFLPGYIITEEIDENAYMKLYRGQRMHDRLSVIIKALRPGANPADIALLVHEYEITRNLAMQGVIKPLRLEWAGLTVALIIEDMKVIPLKKRLPAGGQELSLFFTMAIQLTETLGELHRQGIIHRNLSLDNIYLDVDTGRIIIADFSMATLSSRENQAEPVPLPAGNPAYMSPEQIGRVDKVVDHRSDLYSLGVLFYEILTGRLPLQAGNRTQWVHAHMAKKPVFPGDVNPDIPPAVSAIIMKLLAKAAGERYQSAAGLLADLQECFRQWSMHGVITSFTPGQKDLSALFRLPRKLYGRQKEAAVLTEAYEQACTGSAPLLLVHGYAGTGKTALICDTLKPPATERGYFITGKSDQLQWNIPYAPFIQAFGELIRQILTERPDRLALWKQELLRALGRNGKVITKVIPEVELIVGAQPPVEKLQLWETQNRFMAVFRNFIQTFARREHPLVVFLDDLQWADPASLKLVQYLSKDADLRHLLLIGAYRDNEITEGHPLLTGLRELAKGQVPVRHLPLKPLAPAHVNQFVADTLQCTPEQSQPLSDILYRKSGGNPFFLGQLLLSAHGANLLGSGEQGGYRDWDLAAIGEMPMTDDVIGLMLGKLQKLPAATLEILKIAASIGNKVDLKTLSFSAEKPPGKVAADLWPAIAEGLFLPAKETGKTKKRYRIADNYPVVDIENKYEFLHDRVQQAAYSLLPEAEKKDMHVKIGRLILAFTAEDLLDDKIFTVMDHLNRGLDLITDPEERMRLAEYNLLAGQKARIATAYGAALNYFKYGMDLLPDNAWEACYRLTFDLHTERLQCEYFCANYAAAEQLFALLLAKAGTDLEKADVYLIKILLNSSRERYRETLQMGIRGLKLLGVNLPENPGKIAFCREVLPALWHVHCCGPGNFAGLPARPDPVRKRIMLLLLAQAGAACMVNPALFRLIILKISNFSVKFANREFAPYGCIGYSFFAGSVLGDYAAGRAYAQAALQLIDENNDHAALGIFYFVLGACISHWTEHGQTGINYLQKAVDYCLESGNWLVADKAFTLLIENKYLLGSSLEELYRECRGSRAFAQERQLPDYQRLMADLMGVSGHGAAPDEEADSLTGERTPVGEAGQGELIKGEIRHMVACSFAEMQFHYLTGDYTHALSAAEKGGKNLAAVRGCMLFADYLFYHSLIITAGYEELPEKKRGTYRKILQRNLRQMKKWSAFCPENFLHKYLLMTAERARLDKQDSEAMALYDQAIESAREHGYIQNEAVANEAAARFYLARGREKVAKVYLIDAFEGYGRWGAAGIAKKLQERYPKLLPAGPAATGEKSPETEALLINAFQFAHLGGSGADGNLEAHAVRKAMDQLAAETDPRQLLHSFLEIAIEHAGADKGYLIFEKDETLFIEVAKKSDARDRTAGMPVLLEKSPDLCRRMVRYVARTLEPAVVNDVRQAGVFARDSYLQRSRTKSIVCVPLKFQHIPVGVLYLENSLMSGVFTTERVKVLQFLAGQIAYMQKLQSFLEDGAPQAREQSVNSPVAPLTEREMDVLNLIAEGMSNKEIAKGLYLTVNTVKTHILNIYEKLKVNRRVQAIARARELKILHK